MKYKAIFLCTVSAIAMAGVAGAQNSPPGKSGRDPFEPSTQPLTPKSAMTNPHKTAAGLPPVKNSQSTAAELNQVEKQGLRAPAGRTARSSAVKINPSKSGAGSHGGGSGINATYHPPQTARKRP